MKLVRESFGDAQYRKAMDCLRCLRRECLQVFTRRVVAMVMLNWLSFAEVRGEDFQRLSP